MINSISTQNSNNISTLQKNKVVSTSLNKEQNLVQNSNVSISDSSKLKMEISNYEKQLNEIFGVPKELNNEELKQAEDLANKIDKILGVNDIQLSKSDQKIMDKIDKKIDAIFDDNKVTKEEEKQLNSLKKRQDSILANYEEKELSEKDEKKVISLFKQLDTLQGLKTPSDEKLEEADKIYSNLNKASIKLNKLETEETISFESSAKLIIQINMFNKQLDEIFGIPKKLNEDEQKIEQYLNNEIDKILNIHDIQLSKSDQKNINNIEKQIDLILKDDIISKDEEKSLKSLNNRMESIYSNYETPDLPQKEEKELDNLFKKLDSLYGLKTPDKESLLKAENIYVKLDETYNLLKNN